MREMVAEAYKINLDNYKICYRDDDNDMVTITCEEDFEDALDFFDDKVMKLFICLKESILAPVRSNLVSTINPNVDRRPGASLADSIAGDEEMNRITKAIDRISKNIPQGKSILDMGDMDLDNEVENPSMSKHMSKHSIAQSEESAFDYGIYERDIEETNELINEISHQVEDLGITFEELNKNRKLKQRASKVKVEEDKQTELIGKALLKQSLEEELKMLSKAVEEIKVKKVEESKVEQPSNPNVHNYFNKNAYKHQVQVLKEMEDEKFKDSIHKDISCSMCNSSDILGIRYLCIQCEGFNLCAN
jgi:hypothetical protein